MHAQIEGCTDPLANNYNAAVTDNDGSCTYDGANISPTSSTVLNETLDSTSGLILWENEIWMHTDGGDLTELYTIEVSDLSNFTSLTIPGTTKTDWEDIAQDENYVYIGDFGNIARGNRTDLKIYRIEKNSITAGTPNVDIINFSYADQTDFTNQGLNNTDFDCEALIVTETSIYLFTKEWVSQETTIYTLPKTPGTYPATNQGSYDVNGLITGATYAEGKQLVVLSGYSSFLQPFILLLYDFTENNFLNGNKRKINLDLPFHQVEGIATQDGINYFATNERFVNFITVQSKLHKLNLSDYLLNYLGYETSERDAVLINFSENANNAVDLYDAHKLEGPDENLAREVDSEQLSIENRAMPVDDESLALSINGYTQDQYTFAVQASKVQANFEAYLIDDYTGTNTLLNEGHTEINFSVDATIPESTASDRFSLLFNPQNLGVGEQLDTSPFRVYPNLT